MTSSENDQLTGHFQSFFINFFRPPTLNLKKKSRKSTYKTILALIGVEADEDIGQKLDIPTE